MRIIPPLLARQVTLLEWLVDVGAAVVMGQPVARISVRAEDLNNPGQFADEEVAVLAPAAGRLGEALVAAGALTELGKQIGTLAGCA